jgi:hypothetical protein
MAIINKRLASGTLSNAKATLYTVTAGKTVIIKAITLCNTSASAATITLYLDSIEILSGYSLAANTYLHIPQLDQILESEELLEGLSGTDAVIDYYISGKQF